MKEIRNYTGKVRAYIGTHKILSAFILIAIVGGGYIGYKKFNILLHKTIKKVTDDIESFAFNTAISAMMILLNEMEKQEKINKKDFEMFLKVFSPFAPHVTEEIWNSLGHKTLLVAEKWPKADPKKSIDIDVKIVVQINGKVRAEYTTTYNAEEEGVISEVKELVDVSKWLIGKEIKKTIFIKNKLVNFVI